MATDSGSPPSEVNTHTFGNRHRVLVIEDNADVAATTVRLLRYHGFEVKSAPDGLRGIEDARVFRPDFVLLDIGLPYLNGYELARAFRQDATLTEATLIAVSAYNPNAYPGSSRQAYFDHYLVKPIVFDSLLSLLGNPQRPIPTSHPDR